MWKVRSVRVRQAALLFGSCIVYLSWTHWFFAVLFVSTAMNFLLGEWVRRRPYWPALTSGIVLNLVLLSTFKYLPAFAIHLPFTSLQRFEHLALPLGISFWTFQAMSYLFDQYRGEELDPSFVEFALYMAFFPVTISGPICRMPDMLPQFRAKENATWKQMEQGFQRIATGVLMMQVAKLLGQGILSGDSINTGFDSLTKWSGSDVWCLAIGYGLQLFFDFAGYSHIAIGAAKVLGFTVPENFDHPFQSTSPSIFWTRWHMSLSFWIRDYVFLPCGSSTRNGVAKPGARHFDGGIWPVAQGDDSVRSLGLLPRCSAGVPSSGAAVAANIRFRACRLSLGAAVVADDYGPGQPGMDSLPSSNTRESSRDVFGRRDTGQLSRTLPER